MISNRIMKSQLNITLSCDLIILVKINGGKVIYKANFVKTFDEILSKKLKALKAIPRKIIAKNGIVIDKTLYIININLKENICQRI